MKRGKGKVKEQKIWGQKVRGKEKPRQEKVATGWVTRGRGGFAGALCQRKALTAWRMVSAILLFPSISISPDAVVVYTLKYYEVQQRERHGTKCSRSLTVTNITRWQNENKKIRIDEDSKKNKVFLNKKEEKLKSKEEFQEDEFYSVRGIRSWHEKIITVHRGQT